MDELRISEEDNEDRYLAIKLNQESKNKGEK